MNAQEQQLIDGLVDRVKNVPVADKDDEADRYLHEKLDSAPDALYVLAQTVLVQQYGLTNAQQQLQDAQGQIQDLQDQLAQAQQQAQKKSGSFLGHLLGTDQPSAPPPPQYAPQGSVPYQPVNSGYPPPPPYAQPAGYGYGAPMGSGFGGGGGFLQGALQTAAGVAAGEMVFRGMEDLFSGFGGHEHMIGQQPTEVINNNYYDEPQSSGEHHAEASGNDSSFYDPSNDASRQQDAGSANDFADTGSDDYSDDNGSDDSGGYDDGGGSFDDGN